MPATRYSMGGVTVTLDGDLERFVRRALDAAAGETVRILETAAEEVAGQARAEWYGSDGVRRLTGRTGDIQVVTTVSDDEVRVSVTSTTRDALYVHRPGPLSTVAVEIDKATYERGKNGRRASLYFHARADQPGRKVKAGRYYELRPNPDAGDGKYLVPELIRKPVKLKIQAIKGDLGRSIADRIKRG